MGGLISGPSRPAPAPIVVQQAAPISDPVVETDSSADETTNVNVDEQREENLLQRDRGRFGTVRTGFSGLLGLADTSGQRKSLLGE